MLAQIWNTNWEDSTIYINWAPGTALLHNHHQFPWWRPNSDLVGGITTVELIKGFRRYTVEQLAGEDAE